MRAILVGSTRERARLRAQLETTAIDVVSEFATIAGARDANDEADAIILAVKPRVRIRHVADIPLEEDDPAPVEALTGREMQVLELLAEGRPNKAIADALGISDQTVKSYVSSLSGKLGAVNRTDAVRRAVHRGYIAL
jgi:DNA-binding CsgD family transcriptional regulator